MAIPLLRLWTLCALVLLAGCAGSFPQVLPPDSLAATPGWEVSGRQGWMPGRELRFGDYATQSLHTQHRTRSIPCPNGCSRSDLGFYRQRFDEAFSSSTQLTRFTLAGPAGALADVQLTRRLDEQRRDWVTRWFGLPTDFGRDFVREVTVVGTVQPADPTQASWRFALRDQASGAQLQGWAEDDSGRRLLLTPLQRMAGRAGGAALQLPSGMAFGYALELDQRAVAAVATTGPGQVWIDPSLPAELRLVLAALASALLVDGPVRR